MFFDHFICECELDIKEYEQIYVKSFVGVLIHSEWKHKMSILQLLTTINLSTANASRTQRLLNSAKLTLRNWKHI